MSHGSVPFISYLFSLISVTLILYPAPWPSCPDETGQREGCFPAEWIQTGPPAWPDQPAAHCLQKMQFWLFHLLSHFTKISDRSCLFPTHPSPHDWVILNIGNELNMRNSQINQHTCRNLFSFINQDKKSSCKDFENVGRGFYKQFVPGKACECHLIRACHHSGVEQLNLLMEMPFLSPFNYFARQDCLK